MPEIEAKILEINTAALITRLEELKAPQSFSGELYAIFFDHPGDSLVARDAVLRLRKEGDSVALTFKCQVPGSDPELKVLDEREVTVSDFETTRSILAGMGYKETKATRKFRSQYDLPGAHVVIDDYQDELAAIPPFCEIEAESEARLYEVAAELGYDRRQLSAMNSFQLERHYSNRTGK